MKHRLTNFLLFAAVLGTAIHGYVRFSAEPAPDGVPLRVVVPTLTGQPLPSVATAVLGTAVNAEDAPSPSDPGSACRILYFFDPACGACQESAPYWSGVSELLAGEVRVPVSWVLLGSSPLAAEAFVQEFGITAPVFKTSEEDPHQAFGVQGVPAIWGIRGDTVRHVALGIEPTVPDGIDLRWCVGEGREAAS